VVPEPAAGEHLELPWHDVTTSTGTEQGEAEPTVTAAPSELAYSPTSGSTRPAGPVPIRPLAMGEILDGAVLLLRLYPAATLGLGTVVMAVQLLLITPIQYVTQDVTLSIFDPVSGSGDGSDLLTLLGTTLLSSAVIGIVAALCAGVVTAATSVVVGNAMLGEPAPARAVWAQVRPRLWSVLGLSLLIAVAGLTIPIASFLVSSAFALAIPAMMLERVRPFQAVKRGWSLTFTGFVAYLRLLGIRTLATLVAFVWQFLVALPFMAASQVVISLDAPRSPGPAELLIAVFLSSLGAMAGGVFAVPFLGCVDGLLYTDRRMRAEGFDIDLGQRQRRGVV
jgi:hypothetical protein